MKRGIPVILVSLTLAACTGSPPGNEPAAPDRWVFGGGQQVALQLEATPTSTSIVVPEPRDAVLRAVVGAYEDLGITIGTMDSDRGMVGNRDFEVRRTLGGRRLSDFLNCGIAPQGGRIADRYTVTMDITTVTEPVSSDTTRVITRLSATARNPGGASSESVRCLSNGALEEGILSYAYAHMYGLTEEGE